MPFSSESRVFANLFMKKVDKAGLMTDGAAVRSMIQQSLLDNALANLEASFAANYQGDEFSSDLAKYYFNMGTLRNTAKIASAAWNDDAAQRVDQRVDLMESRDSVVKINATADYIPLIRPMEETLQARMSAIKAIGSRMDDRCFSLVLPIAKGKDWLKALRSFAKKDFTFPGSNIQVNSIDVSRIADVIKKVDSNWKKKNPKSKASGWEEEALKAFKSIPTGNDEDSIASREDVIIKGARRRAYSWPKVLEVLETIDPEFIKLGTERTATRFRGLNCAVLEFSNIHVDLDGVVENAPQFDSEGSDGLSDEQIANITDVQEAISFGVNDHKYTVDQTTHALALLLHIAAYAQASYDFIYNDDIHFMSEPKVYHPGVRKCWGLTVPHTLHALAEYFQPDLKKAWRTVVPQINNAHFEFLDHLIGLTRMSKRKAIDIIVKDLAEKTNQCLIDMRDALDEALRDGAKGIDVSDVIEKSAQKRVYYSRSLLTNLEPSQVVVNCDVTPKDYAEDRTLTLTFSQPVGFLDLPQKVGEMCREFMILEQRHGFQPIVGSADMSSLASVYNAITGSQPLDREELSLVFSPSAMFAEATSDARNNLKRVGGDSTPTLMASQVINGGNFSPLQDFYVSQMFESVEHVYLNGGFDTAEMNLKTIMMVDDSFTYGYTIPASDVAPGRAAGYYASLNKILGTLLDEFVKAYGPASLTLQPCESLQVSLDGENSKFIERREEFAKMSEVKLNEDDFVHLTSSRYSKEVFNKSYLQKLAEDLYTCKVKHDTTGWALLVKLATALKGQLDSNHVAEHRERACRLVLGELTTSDIVALRQPENYECIQSYFKAIHSKLSAISEDDRIVAGVLLFMVVGAIDIK